MKIAIYGRNTDDNTSEYIQLLFSKLSEYQSEIFIYEPFFVFLKQRIQLDGDFKIFNSYADIKGKVDCMLSIGGDGTLLETLTFIQHSGIPVLGINTGRLGFLASVAKTEIAEAIAALFEKQYTIEKRSLLSVSEPKELFGDVNYGLNELTILKKDSSSMIVIHAYINGEFLNSYFADGLIVATPTGSTAYSLSCGGPLIMPGSENFVITPIAPHNLNVRPFVISDNNIITLKVEGRSKNHLVSLDSRTRTIDSSIEITIKKANFYFHLIKLNNQSFFDTMRKKLLWGLDKRN